jgi:23S rRNA (cytidine1920-2'-O)/16S rRNA (cytidine1409-2'-O)-methyltransferase
LAREADCPYVGRGGLKLRHALDAFGLDVAGERCVDLGCSTGGFTDCLLQAGAAHVTAIDTGYGVLDYTLRVDDRVEVRERTNALHADPPTDAERFGVAVVDMSWTPQRLCVPLALRWIKTDGVIVTLIKPHYEAREFGMEGLLEGGVLAEEDAERVMEKVVGSLPGLGVRVEGVTRSPITGGKKKGKGNVEYLALLRAG